MDTGGYPFRLPLAGGRGRARRGRRATAALAAALAVALGASAPRAQLPARDGPFVIDHRQTDLQVLSPAWIDSAQALVRIQYAHTSHGGQVPTGLGRIADGDDAFRYAYENNALPAVPGALCIFNGQATETYVTPDLYWATAAGMAETRAVLAAEPAIDVSVFAWCTELDNYDAGEVAAYLDSMSALEATHPGVVFVYMTGNAQATGEAGRNRWLCNETIRNFCRAESRVLYDFADLDCWWYDSLAGAWSFSYYVLGTDTIPVEHPRFVGDESSHTTFESCEQKARAFWRLAAALAGWPGDTTAVQPATWGGVKRDTGEERLR
ncbi:MAG: hypothetical protein JW876_08205 [Candidatus Krumholzibacteriota bacterium]|nr:hypothetical protein [Candidatus Krumholzibacteriota bacterium]